MYSLRESDKWFLLSHLRIDLRNLKKHKNHITFQDIYNNPPLLGEMRGVEILPENLGPMVIVLCPPETKCRRPSMQLFTLDLPGHRETQTNPSRVSRLTLLCPDHCHWLSSATQPIGCSWHRPDGSAGSENGVTFL